MKKFFAILMTLALMLSLAVPAFAQTVGTAATGTGSITISNATKGESYGWVKVFDASVTGTENGPIAYTGDIPEALKDVFEKDSAGNISVKNSKTDEEVTTAVQTWAKTQPIQNKTESDGSPLTFEGLEYGYYAVISSLGSVVTINSTNPNVTVTDKNPTDTIDKKVQEDSKENDEDGGWGQENDAQVGDTVNFSSKITLRKGTCNVTVTDTMDEGLTYKNDAAIADLTVDTDYTVTNNATGFVITFTDTYLSGLQADTELTLTYSATLNEKAIATDSNDDVSIDPQTNTIVLKYGDKQTVDATTTTTTHKFAVNKKAEGVADLAGAVFSLKKAGTVVPLINLDDTNYRVAKADETGAVNTFITVDSGDIVIWGVDADNDYTLEEITPPAGYNKLTAEVPVTVNANNSTVIDVLNQAGAELPSTGGMGTTIFYIVGGIMVVAAVVLLVTKKRMSAEG